MNTFRLSYLSRGVAAGIGIFLVSGFLGGVIIRAFGEPPPQNFAVAVDSADTWWQLVFVCTLGCLMGPLKEEMLYRGLIYPSLRKIYGVSGGILGSAIFFTAMHFDVIRFLPIFLGGLCLTWLYERSKSLWPSIIAHGVWNGLMLILMLLRKGLEL